MSTSQIIARMFSYIRKYKLRITLYVAFSVCATLNNLAFADLINDSIGSAINGQKSELLQCIVQAVVVTLASIILTFLTTWCYGTFKAKVMLDIRNSAVTRLQKLRLSFIENSHTGDLISRYTKDMSTVQTFIGEELFSTAIMLVTIAISSCYMIVVSWKLFVASMILLPPTIYLSTLWTKPMSGYFREASKNVGKSNSLAQDAYGGIFIVKAFNLEKFFRGRYSEQVQNGVDFELKATHRLRWMPVFNIINWSSPYLICMIYGAWLSINKEITPGQLPAFIYLMGNIVWPVSNLPRVISNFRSSMGTAQRFFEVLDNPVEREDGEDFDCSDAKCCIAFQNVGFSYNADKDGSDRKILNQLNFELRPGRKLALVGASGCGKSTVLKLISSFYDCQDGKIEFFGHELTQWSISALRSKISLVSQDTYLFPANIFDNILYGKPDSTREEVINAARAANAHEFIMELPEGYETLVGERGIKLSGGQKQRLSLARAFLKDAPVILLDEPTSALDTISESQVQEGMNLIMKNKTSIIVTHRLSTIKDVDEIIVMDNGCIVERGTHEQLAATDSLYSRLYSKQTEKGEDVA